MAMLYFVPFSPPPSPSISDVRSFARFPTTEKKEKKERKKRKMEGKTGVEREKKGFDWRKGKIWRLNKKKKA